MAAPEKAFFLGNGVEDATITLTPSDGDRPSFPKENLNDRNLHTFLKFSEAVTAIDFDFGSGNERTADSMCIVNHNFVESDVGIKLITDSSDNPSFPSPQYWVGSSGSYEMPSSVTDEYLWWEDFSTACTTAKRYWRLILLGIDAWDYLAHVLIGDAVMGAVSYDRPRVIASSHGYDTIESGGGHTFASYRHGRRRSWDLKWSSVPTANRTAFFDDFWEHIQGGFYPFAFRDMDGERYWVRTTQKDLSTREDVHQLWGFPLKLIEEI
jgi:hypothetical protein